MRKLDTFWETNEDWFWYDGFIPHIKENAPAEAKESFRKYKEQTLIRMENECEEPPQVENDEGIGLR